jgi:hypothetical protein
LAFPIGLLARDRREGFCDSLPTPQICKSIFKSAFGFSLTQNEIFDGSATIEYWNFSGWWMLELGAFPPWSGLTGGSTHMVAKAVKIVCKIFHPLP